ncbi:acyl carrier protein [Actinokineospora terrae]|uniref:Acyl carrier protein n=1 Tax=Actinokineospora terrae TaxID=155974 RepID=A0A1H9LP31_9PSEU|nr:acyl carrier protein [Actinokineospora terrae]SER13176.1 acyl carrier protein [Actinokineospora terrae]
MNTTILDLVAEKAELPAAQLDPAHTLEDIGLDSLHLMEIALWMQKEYGVVIAEGELHHEQTLGEAIAFLDTRVGG